MQMRFQSTQALCCIAHHCMQNKSLDHTTKNNEKRAMPSIYILLHYSILSPALEGETGRESRMSRIMRIKVTKAISLIYPGCNQVFLHARNNRKGLGHSFKKEYLRKSFGMTEERQTSVTAASWPEPPENQVNVRAYPAKEETGFRVRQYPMQPCPITAIVPTSTSYHHYPLPR